MSKNNSTRTSDRLGRVIAVADFLFADPGRRTGDVQTEFGAKWQVSPRTISRLVVEARQYNQTRIEKQEQKKDEVINREAEKYAGKIITRMESLAILSSIARDEKESSDADRIRAVTQVAAMEGWSAPVKQEIQVSGGVAEMSDDDIANELKRLNG